MGGITGSQNFKAGRNSRACHPGSNHLVLGSEKISKQQWSYPLIHFAMLVGWWRPWNVNEATLNRIQSLPKGLDQSPDARGVRGTIGLPASWWIRMACSLPLLHQCVCIWSNAQGIEGWVLISTMVSAKARDYFKLSDLLCFPSPCTRKFFQKLGFEWRREVTLCLNSPSAWTPPPKGRGRHRGPAGLDEVGFPNLPIHSYNVMAFLCASAGSTAYTSAETPEGLEFMKPKAKISLVGLLILY